MFLLLGVLFLVLGISLLMSCKNTKKEYDTKLQSIEQSKSVKKDKKTNNKIKNIKEKYEDEIKKSKGSGYSFLAAGISCVLAEIILKYLK
ncbi:putative lipoprotein [[Clostridium] bifermentans ATCC 638]|uniref:Putative lipoprotein n=1 Tax=Paraclostridium bifermentans ATCC 638 = DSM 14991 TaxID=1233171 RepID=T4VMU9_PARBF|nr:hypothetical protein [Paraclostridium bifermentans]EQK42818.1 putative lipoprotein [[Clostridium] bifermentans ATCC 638] [Paraclostridium bifermentans ATCC 638 = DSM 14991]RIZ57594.1 hypothetical protein CHH45_15710 [Paraclostridium bifermentans]UAG19612.1 hypothetical protein KXZ80_07855 [Paraclostridium bifermentans]